MSNPSTSNQILYSISGKIFNSENKQGVKGLVVTVYDLNLRFAPTATSRVDEFLANAVRFASFTTSENGEFSYNYSIDDIVALHPGKKTIDLFLLVAGHDDNNSQANSKVLYFTNPPRLNASRSEFFSIGISQDVLVKFGAIDDNSALSADQTIKNKIDAYIQVNTSQQKLNDGIASYHKQLVQNLVAEKTTFRQNFKNKIATNYDIVSIGGVLVKEDDNIQTAVKTVAENTIDSANSAINDENNGVPVFLYLSPNDRQRIFGTTTSGEVQIPEDEINKVLLRPTNTENAGTMLIQNNPISKFCRDQSADEICAREHTGLATGQNPGSTTLGSTTPPASTDATAETVSNDTLPKYIARLIDTMPSPDEVLKPEFNNKRADQKSVKQSVADFSLNKGPADVPAFYDFHSLQIAFDFVWRQLFDEEIVNVAYQANILYKSKFGIELPFVNANTFQLYTNPPDLLEIPAVTAAHFDITKEEYLDLEKSKRDKLDSIAQTLENSLTVTVDLGFMRLTMDAFTNERYLQKLRESGERIIETVRQDDYYSLHKTLRDLHDRIKSKYEFTVFAADKDYHSVNFGLINTYRQTWTPCDYEAGELVKTIPLSPKEERKYSLKVTRNLKKASKEAIKNNTSFTSEQSSTSRVEAEIIAKVQNKSNFSLSAEGDYDIGISSGTAKSSFGLDAQNESSQTRKDSRESVIKAAQDYKTERSIEVNTDESSSYEYNESGTIVNPNDELAVTYLFYELQRRYRISEQLYRVMPVVLVAQEVPSPDQITEAWVISNDWIINRFLLDDSFRPCLRYLSTKSVGDDFEVRELRKNLLEQRNLVSILKIEVSNASTEANDRYLALKIAIDKRIRAQAAANNDGWLSDSFQTVFGGDPSQDAEAAKARELAANDEVRHATDNLEKLSASLQQEINNLHTLTNEYNIALRNLLDYELQIKHLLVHIRNNILYYMQAIWSMEPPDQRFLRLYKVQVPNLESDGQKTCTIEVTPEQDIFQSFRDEGTTKHRGFLKGKLKKPVTFKSLAEVADLDNMLGFKGNYMIFPLSEHNALTEFMAAPFIDTAFGAMDPDQLSNVSLDEYSHYVCCLHDKLTPEKFEEQKPILIEWLKQLLADSLRNGDEIVVPTNSLFIEALPGEHPLLENYKLRHRELDVYKVQAEVRKAEMENLRLAARLLNAEREDPDIEKKIVVEGKEETTIDVDDHP